MINKLRRKIFKENYLILNIPIKDCIHYCGFKYGGQQYNPYETFIYRYFNEPDQIENIKKQFIDFLRCYRPESYNDAFGLKLSKSYPLWLFPWQSDTIKDVSNRVDDPDNIVDILTHFSDKGIPSYKIDQEFYWLKRAIKQIALIGYKPERFSYVEALKFEDQNNNSAYLLLDGNHRVSALHTIGQTFVQVKIYKSSIIRETDVNNWPNVKNGLYTPADALLIFRNYFNGDVCYKTSNIPSLILDYTNNYKQYV